MSAIREQDIILRSGGAELQRSGGAWRRRRRDGREIDAPTFTRADAATCATYRDQDLRIKQAAAAKLRAQWTNSALGLLLERGRPNGWTRSEELDNAAWTKVNASITANALAAPDGTTTADALVEDGTNNLHGISRATPTLTDNTRSTVMFKVRASDRTILRVRTTDKSNTQHSSWFNASTGAWGTTAAGHQVSVETFITVSGGVYYGCSVTFDAASGGTSPAVEFYLATSDGGGAYAGNGTSAIVLWGIDFATDQAYPTSYIPNVGSTLTRASDRLTIPRGQHPTNLTIYAVIARPLWAGFSTSLVTAPYLLSLGTGSQRLGLYGQAASRNFACEVDDGSTVRTASRAIPAGSTLEVCAQFADIATAGKVRIDANDGNGFTSYSSTTGAISSFAGDWVIGDAAHSAGNCLNGSLIKLLVANGLYTLLECQAVSW